MGMILPMMMNPLVITPGVFWEKKELVFNTGLYGFLCIGEYNGFIYIAILTGVYDTITILKYDTELNSISTVGNISNPFYGSFKSSYVIVDNFLYQIGGGTDTPIAQYNTIYRHNLDTLATTSLTGGSVASKVPGVVHKDGFIYRFGGYTGGGLSFSVVSACEKYSIVGDSWSPVTSMIATVASKENPAMISIDNLSGKAYVIGGARGGGLYSSDNKEYNTSLDSWSNKSGFVRTVSTIGSVALDGVNYVFDGMYLRRYFIDTDSWDVLSPDGMFSASAFGILGGKIYVFNGTHVGILNPSV